MEGNSTSFYWLSLIFILIINSQSDVEGCVQTCPRIPRTKLKGVRVHPFPYSSLRFYDGMQNFHPQTFLFLLYLPYASQNENIRELIVYCNFLEEGDIFSLFNFEICDRYWLSRVQYLKGSFEDNFSAKGDKLSTLRMYHLRCKSFSPDKKKKMERFIFINNPLYGTWS